LARNEEERAILGAIMNATEVGTAFFTTPGVPVDRLTALRRAFDATMTDAELLADAQKIHVGVSPMPGEELQTLVAEVSNLSPALLSKVPAAYTAANRAEPRQAAIPPPPAMAADGPARTKAKRPRPAWLKPRAKAHPSR